MGLSVQQVDNQLVCISHDELGRETRSDLTPLLVLGEDLARFLKPIIDEMRLKRPATIRGEIGRLKSIGEALIHYGVTKLPQTASEWQALVINIHRFTLTRTDRKSSLQTRCSIDWLIIRRFLISLIEAGIIPISIYLPPVREILDSVDISPYQDRLLGQSPAQVVSVKAPIDKLICSVSLARTDAEYLEELRDTLSYRRHILLEALSSHWRQIKANMKFGKKLIESVDWEQLRPQVAMHPLRDPSNHPANPCCSLAGLANYLAVIRHEYDGCPPSDDDLRIMKRKDECLPRLSTFVPIAEWARKLGAPEAPYGCKEWSQRRILWWWQGRISHFDVALISALLIMLHPSWTPVSLMMAKVTNRNGKQYLDMSDAGRGFEIEKPRAKAMKHESLDPLAYEIISTLIDETVALRKDLAKAGDAKASLLFLPHGLFHGESKVVAPIVSAASAFLSGKVTRQNSLWIGLMYPELVKCGLTAGTISFKKIRNTEGVLEWFKTKSLRAVSRKLGNTERVVLQHYIPRALLDAEPILNFVCRGHIMLTHQGAMNDRSNEEAAQAQTHWPVFQRAA